jgi:DNA-binding Lrp family transcriptional regulator
MIPVMEGHKRGMLSWGMPSPPDALQFMLQKSFPCEARPFHAMGLGLGISEAECLQRVRAMKAEGLIRQVSAIFDSRRLGYQSALIAARIPAARLEAGAALVSAYPGVSHNYERGHDFNLWFTLALAPGLDFEAEAARLARQAGAEAWMALPSLRTFKIEVALDAQSGPAQERVAAVEPRELGAVELSGRDKELVRALQDDIPLQERLFLPLAQGLGIDEDLLFSWMADAKERGILRRFAAILRHRKAGFSFNGMGVWRVPAGRVEACGRLLATYKAVSHCYERPTRPGWDYNLFSMVHAQSAEACAAIFKELSAATGISDYQVLFSSREFKKARVRYFLEKSPA